MVKNIQRHKQANKNTTKKRGTVLYRFKRVKAYLIDKNVFDVQQHPETCV